MSTASTPKLGVLCGLVAEADILRHAVPAKDQILVAITAARPGRARACAERLIAQGATGIASFGLAGGLDPALAPGALLLPERVIGPDGAAYPTDSTWRRSLEAITGAEQASTLLGSDTIVATPADKARLFRETGAAAVDMESHAAAAVAAAAKLPFLVVRAVADPAGRAIPRAAMAGLDAEGRTLVLPVILALTKRPGDLPGLLRLAADSRAGFATLRRVALASLGGLALGV
ncbi:MAG: phosphorylase family protein [Alphaproteobacteria bacterium]